LLIKRFILWLLYTVVLRHVLTVLLGVRFIGREHLRTTEQFVIVSNHNSHLDTISILSAIPSKRLIEVKPIAAADYFARTKLKAWLTRFFINALFIPRKRPKSTEDGPDPIDMLIEAVDQGNSLIVFPEGTRGLPDQMERFKRGIGLVLAERPNVAVIPAYFKGIGRVWPKGELIPVPYNSPLEFGQPFHVENSEPDLIAMEVQDRVVFLKMKAEQA
jgi:1-acyl-sn-glycerol-3-phosphate acyltransferase